MKVLILAVILILASTTGASVRGHREFITKQQRAVRVSVFCKDWLRGYYVDRNNDGGTNFKDYALMLKGNL